ncbi:uncharacterized protein LOC111379314 [Olea europaea var. sylvestris]|uniref:uncharacterized protein LOC111379314 n=1 Tax=Olea europaea var. sylvestris TaxID=158386 RepID=UPI000C1D2BBF|nr:uncharacterized protein LOC111379314 [Olea europaea var. sylvestris]
MKQPKLKVSRPPIQMPLVPRFLVMGKCMIKSPSVTKQEIANYWKQRRMVEEDHLSAAIKAAAWKRAQNLSEHDYQQFEYSLKANDEYEKQNNKGNGDNKEIRVGIKDWWMKSEYSYLNQPTINLVDNCRRRYSTYTPQILCDKYDPQLQHSEFNRGFYIDQMA